MTVYLDVLIILNIYVNYFLLKATAKLTHTKLYTSKCVISSLAGSLFSLTILLPPLNLALTFLIKLLAALAVVALAFGISDIKRFFKTTLFFLAINFIFAGIMLAIYIFIQPNFMGFNNAYFYIDFSLITLVISTIIAYLAVSIIRRLLDRKAIFNEKYSIIISANGNILVLNAIPDTGNTLVDIFSGQPVIICSTNKLSKILPNDFCSVVNFNKIDELKNFVLKHKELKGLRLIPFSTINSGGVIPIFSPDRVCIKAESTNEYKDVNALIGICENQGNTYDAIFNPNLII